MKIASITGAMVTFALLAFACTTTVTTIEEPGAADAGGDAAKGSSSSSGSSGTGEEEEEEETEDTPAGSCGEQSTFQKCGECCADEYPKGYQDYTVAGFTCLCKADNCGTECADTVCADQPQNPDQACDACLDEKTSACQDEFVEACSASQDCVNFNNCLADNCADKR